MQTKGRELLAELRALIAEEMYLLGQELDDSLEAEERRRLTELAEVLNEAAVLLAEHRAVQPER